MGSSGKISISNLFTNINGIEGSICKKHWLLVRLIAVRIGVSGVNYGMIDLENNIRGRT